MTKKWEDVIEENEDDLDNTQFWPGFIVVCAKCGSGKVVLDNTLGYSPESGSWGSIDLICRECGNQVAIYEN